MPGQQLSPGGRRRDPLLGTVRIVLTIAMGASVAIAAAIVACTPLLFIWKERIIEGMSRRAGTPLDSDIIYAMHGAQLLIALTAVLIFLFNRHLRRIVDTVADGDPFIPQNAVRLRTMGWIAVTVQLIALPAGALAGWISYKSHVQYIDIGVSLGGIVLALILFVLARVFGKGAEMRDELEGTV